MKLNILNIDPAQNFEEQRMEMYVRENEVLSCVLAWNVEKLGVIAWFCTPPPPLGCSCTCYTHIFFDCPKQSTALLWDKLLMLVVNALRFCSVWVTIIYKGHVIAVKALLSPGGLISLWTFWGGLIKKWELNKLFSIFCSLFVKTSATLKNEQQIIKESFNLKSHETRSN